MRVVSENLISYLEKMLNSTHMKNLTLDILTASRYAKTYLRSGNSHVWLKNSTEHAETLFIALSFHLLFDVC